MLKSWPVSLILMMFLPLAGGFLARSMAMPVLENPIGPWVCQFQLVANLAPVACEFGGISAVLLLTSLVTGAIALSLIVLFFLGSFFAFFHQRLLTVIFPKVATLANVLNGVFLLALGVHIIVMLWALYVSSNGTRPSNTMLAIIALGVVSGVGKMLTMSMDHKSDLEVLPIDALRLDTSAAPALMQTIEDIADALKVQRPDNIFIGLDPEFWFTQHRLQADYMEKAVKGRSLYLSLPLMRVMSAEEFKAAIAHELAHFGPSQRAYSEGFAPVYRRVAGVFRDMNGEQHPLVEIAMTPVRATIRMMVSIFGMNLRKVAKGREASADAQAAKLAGADAMAGAIAKMSAFESLWNELEDDQIVRASGGMAPAIDLTVIFSEAAYVYSDGPVGKGLVGALGRVQISHPFDVHPPSAKRIRSLKVGINSGNSAELLDHKGEDAATVLLPMRDSIGRDLTRIFNDKHNSRKDRAPAELKTYIRDRQRALLSIIADIVCCGEDEISRTQTALEVLTAQVDGFDRFDFLGLLSGRIASHQFDDALEVLRQSLKPDAARGVVAMAKTIAKDGPARLPDQQAEYLALLEMDLGDLELQPDDEDLETVSS